MDRATTDQVSPPALAPPPGADLPAPALPSPEPRSDPEMASSSRPAGPACIPSLLRAFERHGFRRVHSRQDPSWKRKFFKNLSKTDICRELRLPCTPDNIRAIQSFWQHSKHSWLSLRREQRPGPPPAGKKERKKAAKGPPLQPQPVNRRPPVSSGGPPKKRQAPSRSPDREGVAGPSTVKQANQAGYRAGSGPWAPGGLGLGGYPLLPPVPAHHEFPPNSHRAYSGPPPLMSNPPAPFPHYAAYNYPLPSMYGLGHNPYHVSNGPAKKRDRDEIREQSVALSKAREDVEKEIDLMLEKQKTMSKVQKLKDRLRDKTASLPTDSTDLAHEPDEVNIPRPINDVALGGGSNWHLNADIQLSTEDYRLVGAGVVPATTSDVPEPLLENPTSVVIYSKTTEESDKSIGEANPQPRIANAPQWKDVGWWQEKAKKARLASKTREIEERHHIPIRKRLRPASPSEDSSSTCAMSDEDRSKYESMVKHLKQTMVKSKQSDLNELVDCPKSMKRVLMSKLVNEHRSSISQRLDKLRFNGKTYQSDNDLELIKHLEETALELEEVDLEALPDSFVNQIERFIIQEKFTESQPEGAANDCDNLEIADEEIVEVPIPPKPPVLLIDLDTDTVAPLPNEASTRKEGESINASGDCSKEKQHDGTIPKRNEQNLRVSPQTPVNANCPLEDDLLLINLDLEEETLLLRNQRLCDELRKNNDRLQCLRELRMNQSASKRN